MEPLRWQLAGHIQIAMSLAGHGDLRLATARTAWCRLYGIPEPAVIQQVHGSVIHAVTGTGSSGDGLVSSGTACAVFGSDCPPLAIATRDALGVAHCGWRGTAAGIVPTLVERLRALSTDPPTAWQALIGPGVHPDDFEVDAPVLQARSWPRRAVLPGRPGRVWLDLPAAIASDCAACGIGMVARTRITTSRDPRLRSHRRDGPGFPQMLVAWRGTCVG